MRFIRSVLPISLAVLVLSGCASTRFQVSGQTPQQPLCRTPGEQASVLVLWGTKWRHDQKEVPRREAFAQRGIQRFFSSSGCFSTAKVVRTPGPGSTGLSPTEIRALVVAEEPAPSLVLFITVRELGPILKIQPSLAFVEGATDVVLDIRAVNPATGRTTADFTAHWQNGGPFVIKDVATLEQDIGSALQEALKSPGSGKFLPWSSNGIWYLARRYRAGDENRQE